MGLTMIKQEVWKESHLVADDSEDQFVSHTRDELLMEAHHAKAYDPQLSDMILSDVGVVDMVDGIINKMMKK